MPPPTEPPDVHLIGRICGTAVPEDRLRAVLQAYEPILAEIAKLRALDLQTVHPAVVYEPTAPYRLQR